MMDLVKTAYHEAGHAVVYKALGAGVFHAHIIANEHRLGVCKTTGSWRDDVDPVLANAMLGFAGDLAAAEAMRLFNMGEWPLEKRVRMAELAQQPRPYWPSSDSHSSPHDNRIVSDAFLWQLASSTAEIPSSPLGMQMLEDAFKENSRRRAHLLLNDHWNAVECIALVLLTEWGIGTAKVNALWMACKRECKYRDQWYPRKPGEASPAPAADKSRPREVPTDVSPVIEAFLKSLLGMSSKPSGQIQL